MSDYSIVLPVVLDTGDMPDGPRCLPVCGEYRSTLDTYGDGDVAVLQMDVNGCLRVATAGVSRYENTTYAETESEAEDSEFTTSVMYGLDTEAAATLKLRAVQVAVDNAGVSATPNVLIIGGVYKNAWDTYGDNDAAPLHTDVNGVLATALFDGATESDILADGADAVANTENELVTAGLGYGFNGASWDRQRTMDGLSNSTAGAGVTLKNFHNDELGIQPAVIMGYDSTTDANSYRAVHVDTAGNFTSVPAYVEAELIDTTNVAAATTYYPDANGLALGNYRQLTVMGVISGGVTATIEATLDDAVPPDWLDITRAGYDLLTNTTGNASFVDTNFILDFERINIKTFRVVSVTSDATNAVQYHIRRQS